MKSMKTMLAFVALMVVSAPTVEAAGFFGKEEQKKVSKFEALKPSKIAEKYGSFMKNNPVKGFVATAVVVVALEQLAKLAYENCAVDAQEIDEDLLEG